jgi:protein-L-isoaspartate(D-aspartate) O-methyltransferase
MSRSNEKELRSLREHMVRTQIESRGVRNSLVLQAMREVPRHEFVSESEVDMAYVDRPLPIGHGQTISQPYIVAYMTEALRLRSGERVLEIGTGFGYQAAVLSRIASEVYTIDRVPELVETARHILDRLGYDNVYCRTGDGTEGWSDKAPFDGIIATAAAPRVPEPLQEQLAVGGRLVMPIGEYRFGQHIVRMTKGTGGSLQEERLLDVAFVPMIGRYGWEA